MPTNELTLVPILMHIADLYEETDRLRYQVRHMDEERQSIANDQIKYNEIRIQELWDKFHQIYADLQMEQWHASHFINEYGPVTGPVVFRYVNQLRLSGNGNK